MHIEGNYRFDIFCNTVNKIFLTVWQFRFHTIQMSINLINKSVKSKSYELIQNSA